MDKIDVVIAWVDGSDPAHQKKRAKYQTQTDDVHKEAVLETRFGHCGEIYYCIASILKYAAFVNRIWIITDQQVPKHLDAFSRAGLCQPDFIKIVDHKTVFAGFESSLPTFSSGSIEGVIWRIPELAECFVYLNDDFFFNKPIFPDYLFQSGKPVLRGTLEPPDYRRLKVRIRKFLRKITFRPANNRPSFRISQERGANLAGTTGSFLHFGHHPHPMRKSVISEFFAENGYAILEKQVSYRFRNVGQYNPISLNNHLEINKYDAQILPPVGVAYFKPNAKLGYRTVFDLIRNNIEPYGCLQSLDQASTELLCEIQKMMAEKFEQFLPQDIDLLT